MTDRHQAVVIGGGVIGASCGVHLAEAGVDDILILERDSPASKASKRAAGIISIQKPPVYKELNRNEPVVEHCLDFYRDLASRHTGMELYSDDAYKLAHTPESAEKLDRFYELVVTPVELLSADELAEEEPEINTENVAAALAFRNALHTDPYSLTRAFLDEARQKGVEIRSGVTARLELNGAGKAVVQTPEGEYAPDTVVVAGGAWSRDIVGEVGVDIPVAARTAQIAVLESSLSLPMIYCPDFGMYARELPTGDVLVGGGADIEVPDPDDFTTEARDSFLKQVQEDLPSIVPRLEGAEVIDDWAGRPSSTPDRLPLIGETGIENLYLCTGMNGTGISYAPFAGRVLSDIVSGQAPRYDPQPYAPSRFSGDEEVDVTTSISW
jgi:sarcosine oxidase subunit beta